MRKAAFFICVAKAFALTSCTEEFETNESFVSPITQNERPGPLTNQNGNNETAQLKNSNNTETNTSSTEANSEECTKGSELNTTRTDCSTTLSYTPSVSISVSGSTRTISSNSIPNHMVGIAGPNSPSPQSSHYTINSNPQIDASTTELLGNNGPVYSFGILLNGVEVNPIAAEPWPHDRSSLNDAN